MTDSDADNLPLPQARKGDARREPPKRSDHPGAFAEAERLAAIVEGSDDAIISKTLDGVIATWNAGATRIFGYTAEEMIGRPIATIIPLDLLDEERDIIARLKRGERIEHFLRHRSRAGCNREQSDAGPGAEPRIAGGDSGDGKRFEWSAGRRG